MHAKLRDFSPLTMSNYYHIIPQLATQHSIHGLEEFAPKLLRDLSKSNISIYMGLRRFSDADVCCGSG